MVDRWVPQLAVLLRIIPACLQLGAMICHHMSRWHNSSAMLLAPWSKYKYNSNSATDVAATLAVASWHVHQPPCTAFLLQFILRFSTAIHGTHAIRFSRCLFLNCSRLSVRRAKLDIYARAAPVLNTWCRGAPGVLVQFLRSHKWAGSYLVLRAPYSSLLALSLCKLILVEFSTALEPASPCTVM